MLRELWFENNKRTFWNYNLNELMIGLEVEYFIGRGNEKSFSLINKQDYKEISNGLVKKFNYRKIIIEGEPERISKETEFGYIAIKPDFAWHILEIALPPRHKIIDIEKILEQVFYEVDFVLSDLDLKRLDFSCLPFVPNEIELLPIKDLIKGKERVERGCDRNIFMQPMFPALIAATQVHFNILDDFALSKLPSLYKLDKEFQHMLSRKQVFLDYEGFDFRSNFFNFGLISDYPLKGVPGKIPTSIEDYTELYNLTLNLISESEISKARDLSLIRPTNHGTVEFRSSCTSLYIEKLISIIDVRLNQLGKVINNSVLTKKGSA